MNNEDRERAKRALGIDKMEAEDAARKIEEEKKQMLALHRETLDQAERHHIEILREQRIQAKKALRISRYGAWIAALAALAAVSSAWYAKVQADASLLAAQLSISNKEPPVTKPQLQGPKVDLKQPVSSPDILKSTKQ